MDGTRKNSIGATQKEKRKRGLGSPLTEAKQKALFAKYIEPNLRTIRSLTVKYTDKFQDVEDNYIQALQQMFMYIHTYDETKPLSTWIHIVTKRACFHQNLKMSEYKSGITEIDQCSSEALHQHGTSNIMDAGFGALADNISDDIYNALLSIEPRKLSAFLLYAQGTSIRDIAKIEYRNGHLERKSEELIRSRIFWARKELIYILEKNGVRAKSHKGKGHD